MKHTPGPWKFVHQWDGSLDVVAPKNEGGLVVAVCGRTADAANEFSANASLIAAAPNMYEAIRYLLEEDLSNGQNVISLGALEMLRFAKRKAEEGL